MTTYWAPLIHIYQPPSQELNVLKSIDKECYKPLFALFENYNNIKFCLNISGVLIELLHEFNLSDTVDLLITLYLKRKLKL
jgi:alpha-amylase/alpha-mannosidase (GH57 family)